MGLDAHEFNATRREYDSKNPVYIAIENQREDVLKLLTELGINICTRSAKGRSAFHYKYIRKFKWPDARTMVGLGFDANAKDDQSATPIHYAAIHGTAADIQELSRVSSLVD